MKSSFGARRLSISRTMVLLGLVSAAFLASPSSAQEDRPGVMIRPGQAAQLRPAPAGELGPASISGVPVFRGPAADRRVEDRVDPPSMLDPSQVAAILQTLGHPPEPGSLYVRVSPSQPDVPGKGALVFVEANLVEGGEGYAEFKNKTEPGPLEGYTVLWLYSPAGRSYLVDCAVSGMYWNLQTQQGPVFMVSGPGNTVQTFDYRAAYDVEGYHLVFSLVADQAGWYPFVVSTQPAGAELLTVWKLFSCEAKNL